MVKFSLHGGLVFDELKLSENIAVKASGEFSGFADLGSITEPGDKTSLSDHALIVMFQPFQEQFLIIINNLSFYSLARPPRGGNSQPELISALLEPSDASQQNAGKMTTLVDKLLDEGNLSDAADMMEKHSFLINHKDYVEKKSDSRLTYYGASYIVRKTLKRISCLEGRIDSVI
ncbi:hypothetical protein HPB50_017559 [Hyalomma asiaticum]|uniref:Uncharacterized protein n=1 Tax=Hyalomma asiaticum TaxID=266040 RepID=A0ACB7SP88_HYAAI|nr:hypothetical protein HPB50_017559 [Hyalomma asiaticum]